MTRITDTTSSSPLPSTNSPLNNQNTGTSGVAPSTNSTSNTAGASGAGSTGGTANGSSVTSLSAISTQLKAVQAASSSDPVFSENRVDEIKQAIAKGLFHVNSEKVTDGLLDSVRDLLGSRQRG